jgi:hypothetical protein
MLCHMRIQRSRRLVLVLHSRMMVISRQYRISWCSVFFGDTGTSDHLLYVLVFDVRPRPCRCCEGQCPRQSRPLCICRRAYNSLRSSSLIILQDHGLLNTYYQSHSSTNAKLFGKLYIHRLHIRKASFHHRLFANRATASNFRASRFLHGGCNCRKNT